MNIVVTVGSGEAWQKITHNLLFNSLILSVYPIYEMEVGTDHVTSECQLGSASLLANSTVAPSAPATDIRQRYTRAACQTLALRCPFGAFTVDENRKLDYCRKV